MQHRTIWALLDETVMSVSMRRIWWGIIRFVSHCISHVRPTNLFLSFKSYIFLRFTCCEWGDFLIWSQSHESLRSLVVGNSDFHHSCEIIWVLLRQLKKIARIVRRTRLHRGCTPERWVNKLLYGFTFYLFQLEHNVLIWMIVVVLIGNEAAYFLSEENVMLLM